MSPALAGGFLTTAPPGKCWPIFLIGFFVFLLLSFESSLFIWGNSPLPDMIFANIFSQPVAYPVIHLALSFTERKF